MPEILVDKSTAEAIVSWGVSRRIRHSGDMSFVAPDIVAIDLAPFDYLAFGRHQRDFESNDTAVLRLLEELSE